MTSLYIKTLGLSDHLSKDVGCVCLLFLFCGLIRKHDMKGLQTLLLCYQQMAAFYSDEMTSILLSE